MTPVVILKLLFTGSVKYGFVASPMLPDPVLWLVVFRSFIFGCFVYVFLGIRAVIFGADLLTWGALVLSFGMPGALTLAPWETILNSRFGCSGPHFSPNIACKKET